TGTPAPFARNITVNNNSWEPVINMEWDTGGKTLTITGNVTANVPLTIGGPANTTITGIISGAGGVTMNGAGTLTLLGANTYTGATTVTQGAVSVSDISNLVSAGSAVVLGGASTSGRLSYTGVATGLTGSLTVNAGGGEVDMTTSGQTLTI